MTKRKSRNYECHCLYCLKPIEAYKRSQKFCCERHRNAYNERRRKFSRILAGIRTLER